MLQIVDLSADFRLKDVETYAKVGLVLVVRLHTISTSHCTNTNFEVIQSVILCIFFCSSLGLL